MVSLKAAAYRAIYSGYKLSYFSLNSLQNKVFIHHKQSNLLCLRRI